MQAAWTGPGDQMRPAACGRGFSVLAGLLRQVNEFWSYPRSLRGLTRWSAEQVGVSCEKLGHGQSCLVAGARLHMRLQMESVWDARGQHTDNTAPGGGISENPKPGASGKTRSEVSHTGGRVLSSGSPRLLPSSLCSLGAFRELLHVN